MTDSDKERAPGGGVTKEAYVDPRDVWCPNVSIKIWHALQVAWGYWGL